jgi:hypothetical protein
MLVGQLAACDPAVCDDVDVPLMQGLTEIVRGYTIKTSGSVTGLCNVATRSIVGPPRCLDIRTSETAISDLGAFIGDDTMNAIDSNGTTFAEYKWSYSSNAVFTNPTAGIYKRTGTNTVLATGLSCKYRKYTFTASTYSFSQMEQSIDYVLWRTTQLVNCTIGNCDPGTIDVYVNKYLQEVTSSGTNVAWSVGSTGLPGTITFNYLPVSTINVPGINITILSGGPWKIRVDNATLVISNASGTTYSFTGTFNSVVSAINATSGGTLFSAAVQTGVLGAVATISDLKPFETDYQSAAACATGLPLVLAGEDLAPSSLSQSHFIDTAFLGSIYAFQVPFDSSAIALGYEDNREGYLRWLKQPKYPKYPPGYDPSLATLIPLATSYSIWNDLTGEFFFGTATGLIKYWSDTPGASLFPWTFNTGDYVPPTDTMQYTEYVSSTGCFTFSFCNPGSGLCGGAGFTCSFPQEPYVCLANQEEIIPNDPKIWGGSVNLTGLWVIQ